LLIGTRYHLQHPPFFSPLSPAMLDLVIFSPFFFFFDFKSSVSLSVIGGAAIY
jgi:hypothetical protein